MRSSIPLSVILSILHDAAPIHANQHAWKNRPTVSRPPPSSSTSHPPQHESLLPPAAADPSPYDYTPITALDDYGQSLQLRHALRSSRRYGTPVLACLCRRSSSGDDNDEANAVVVTSLQRPRRGILPPTCSMVRILSERDDAPTAGMAIRAAAVATGVRADAAFLMDALRRYGVSEHWFRYDELPREEETRRRMRRVLLDFMGYEWEREVGSASVSGGAEKGGEEEEEGRTRAGRPLGICVLLLGLGEEGRPSLTVVRANGSSEGYVAYAMGVGSALGNERLARLWRRGMTDGEAKGMMREIFKEIAVESGWLGDARQERPRETIDSPTVNELDENRIDSNVASEFTIVCETVSSAGIDVEYLKL